MTLGHFTDAMADSCRSFGVEATASRFRVSPTAEDAARAVAEERRRWSDAAYEGCFAHHLFAYALGRSVASADHAALVDLTKRFAASGHKLPELIVATAISRAFTETCAAP